MARIRTIKPEFWSSPAMPTLDPWARLLFIAMWNWADDSGRGTADPRTLGGFAFPNDEHITSADIRRMLGGIRRAFGVIFYEVQGRPYFYVPSWDKHQKIDKRSAPRHPSPEEGRTWNPEPTDADWATSDQQGPVDDSKFGAASAGSAEFPPNVRRDSGGNSAGEVGTEEVGSNTRPPAEPEDTDALFGAEQAGQRQDPPPPPEAEKPLTEAKAEKSAEWREFWYQAFPRREGRAPALKAWVKAVGSLKVEPKVIIAGAYAYAKRMRSEQTPVPKIKMAQGWLNDRRWEDEPTTAPKADIPAQQSLRCERHPRFPASTCGPCRSEGRLPRKAGAAA